MRPSIIWEKLGGKVGGICIAESSLSLEFEETQEHGLNRIRTMRRWIASGLEVFHVPRGLTARILLTEQAESLERYILHINREYVLHSRTSDGGKSILAEG